MESGSASKARLDRKEAAQQIRLVVDRAVEVISTAKPGTITTTRRVLNAAAENLGIQLSSLEDFEGGDLFGLHCAIRDRIDDIDSIFLDSLSHYGKVEGLPYNLDFVIRRRIGENHRHLPEILRNLESLHFCIGSLHQGHKEVVLVHEASGWRALINNTLAASPDLTFEPSFQATPGQMQSLVDGLAAADVLNWDELYWDDVLDGTQWELELGLTDGLALTSHGSNAFPEGFDCLVSALEQLGLSGI